MRVTHTELSTLLGQRSPVSEVQVPVAIRIVVEPRRPGPEGLGEVHLATGAVLVDEIDARLFAHVDESDGRRRILCRRFDDSAVAADGAHRERGRESDRDRPRPQSRR